MNVSLGSRNIFQNYSKYNALAKSALLKPELNLRRLPAICKCSTVSNITSKTYIDFLEIKLNNNSSIQRKWYSEEKSGPPSNKFPQLMPDFPKLIWPSLFKSIRNFILATFIIKPYFDREFNLPDFVAGSKRAVEANRVISRSLSEGDLKSLEGLVTNDIIPSLQRAVGLMSLTQREQIAINTEDIYFSFPYQVGIIFNDEEGQDQKRFVEITMVFHSLKGLSLMRSRGEEPPLNMAVIPEYQKRISICNYRFIREFTTGCDGDWTVNQLNHFKPVDEEQDR